MEVYEIISRLTTSGARLAVVDGQLRINASEDIMTPELQALIKTKKEEIVNLICRAGSTIGRAARKEYYPLSSQQKRLYFLYELDRSSLAYNESGIYRLEGRLDPERLTTVFRKLISRHEVLRTSFELVNGEPFQKIAESVDFSIKLLAGREDETESFRQFIRPFDLSKPPLIRIGVVARGTEEHLLMVDIHHIVTDGISKAILINDFMALYSDRWLPEPPIQYKDYAEWQQSAEEQAVTARQRDFWLGLFPGPPAALDLPADFLRPPVKDYSGGIFHFTVDRVRADRLRQLAAREKTTLFTVYLCLYNILLARLSNHEEIVIGTPTAGRQHADLENIMGLFINTVPLQNSCKPGLRFSEFLAEVNRRTLECFDNQGYPYEELVNALKVERSLSRNPLFDALFIFQNFINTELSIPGLAIQPYKRKYNVSKFDITLEVFAEGKQVELNFEYSTELFREETIRRFAGYFERILSAVAADADIRIGEIGMIPDEEMHRILVEFNATGVEVDRKATLVTLFGEAVKASGDKPALVYEDRELSYREVDERSDRLAMRLRKEHGIGPERIVAIMAERSERMVIGMLGILKAGGAYLPIDPAYPQERVEHMLSDSGAELLLVSRGHGPELTYSGAVVVLEEAETGEGHPEPVNGPGDLCYMIYTSGSTGRPKGVMISHGNVVNFFSGMDARLPVGSGDRMLAITSISFDISVLELLWTLCRGVEVVIHPADISLNQLDRYESQERPITMMQSTPSFMRMVLEGIGSGGLLGSLRCLLLGGEAIPPVLVKQLRGLTKARIFNMYGPTETAIWSCVHEFGEEMERVLVGSPIANTRIYILDKELGVVPVGVAGELYIGGEGVSRGYWGRPELTAERFIVSRYEEGRIYKTGDIARWDRDGNIELLGREDQQVKIRGHRIELGEIESQLSAYEGIMEAVVVAREKDGEKYLAAYYVTEEQIGAGALRNYLSGKYPPYMIPGRFMRMERLPLTANGKIDRKALPEPEAAEGKEQEKPLNETEEKLAGIWSEVLKLEQARIGMTTDFFELGGHSIKAIHLVNKIKREFSVPIELRAIFQNNTIRRQSEWMTQMGAGETESIPYAGEMSFYPVSSAQARLYYETILNPDSLIFNIAGMYEIIGKLDEGKIERSLETLICRHEGLRTSFSLLEGEIIQTINKEVQFRLATIDDITYETPEEAVSCFLRPFDLAGGCLMRCGLLNEESGRSFLLVDIHHIVCDAISLNILMQDFADIYQGKDLAPMQFRYVDYACWQKNSPGVVMKQREFWRKKLSGTLTKIELPALRDTGEADIHSASRIDFEINDSLCEAIRKLSSSCNVSEYMLLLSVYFILISKMSDTSDIVIGTEALGRTRLVLQDIVGTFVNILPIRAQVEPSTRFEEFLREVKELVLEALENQDYQFEQMLGLIDRENGLPDGRIFDLYFSYFNAEEEEARFKDVEFMPVPLKARIKGEYAFSINVTSSAKKIQVGFVYCNELYEDDTIRLLAAYYKSIICSVIADRGRNLSDIELSDFFS